jgi:hypothetical protein
VSWWTNPRGCWGRHEHQAPLIYADPPWKFDVYSENGLERTADQHYPTLTDDKIINFRVQGVNRRGVGAPETPRSGAPQTRRDVMADDGRDGRLTLCTEATVVVAVLLDPVRAAALAAKLIVTALPKLGT